MLALVTKQNQIKCRFSKPVVAGKLVTVDLPTPEDMNRFNEWYDKIEEINQRIQMLNEKIKEAETEEVRNAYQKEQFELITGNRQPKVTPKISIRARTIESGSGLIQLEPAFPKDCKTLAKHGYNF